VGGVKVQKKWRAVNEVEIRCGERSVKGAAEMGE